MNCNEFVEAFARAEISDAMREHVRSCARCHALINALTREDAVESAIEPSTRVAEAEVVRVRKSSMLTRSAAILAAVVVFFGWFLVAAGKGGGLTGEEALLVAATGVFIAIIVGASVLLLFQGLATARRAGGDRRFYKRLGPGRMLSGVCLGLAEATGVSVSLFRLGFMILAWLKGFGVLAYIICDLAMPVHPADREHLLRFKIARALRRIFHGERATGAHEG